MFDWIGVLDWITYAIVLQKKEAVAKFGYTKKMPIVLYGTQCHLISN